MNTHMNFAIYTPVQLIWHRTNRIGCAHHFCPNLGGDYMVCNYLEFGNFPSSGHPAYEVEGAPCSACNLPGGTACIDNQCFDCANPDLPEVSVRAMLGEIRSF